MANRSYYKTLGVSQQTTQDEIDDAYRKLIKKHHPDSNPGDETAAQKTQQLNEAYQTLKSPQSRRKYDDELRSGTAGAPSGQRVYASGPGTAADRGDPLRTIFRGMQQRARRNAAASAGDEVPSAATSVTRKETEFELSLTPDEAKQGTTRTLDIEGQSVTLRVPPGQKDRSVLPLIVRIRIRG